MLKCRDVVEQSDALLAQELGWRARLALRMHLFMCVNCRRYLRQLQLMLRALALYRRRDTEKQSEDMIRRLLSTGEI